MEEPNTQDKMLQEKFYSLLNKAFELMADNKLREDIDDTLLEKLLGVIEEESKARDDPKSPARMDFFEELIQKTNALHLAEQAVLSLSFPNSVIVFSLRLMGLIFKQERIFISLRTSQLLVKLPISLRFKMPAIVDGHLSAVRVYMDPSTLDAVLKCLFHIAQHSTGTLWIIEENLLEFVFNSFSCTSYYVRKTAVDFFKDILPLWTSKLISFSSQEQAILREVMKKILSYMIKGLKLDNNGRDRPSWFRTRDITLGAQFSDCCSSVLKECLKCDDLKVIILQSQLFMEILHQFDYEHSNQKSNFSSLLLSLFECDENFEGILKGFLLGFVEKYDLPLALNLASSFLLTADKYKPFSKDHLYFFLMPLCVLSGKKLEKEKIFLRQFEPLPVLLKYIENRHRCVELVSTSLCALSKMTSEMNLEALNMVVDSIEIVVQGRTSNEHHYMAYNCLENRSIILALLELLKSLLSKALCIRTQCPTANGGLYELTIFKYLLCFLGRPSFDCNILSEVLRLLNEVIGMNAKFPIGIPDDVKERFVQLLSRKILDKKESVVDNALLIGGQILSGKDNEVWPQMVFKHNIHMIIWEIAVEGSHEGFIKASALNVIINACLIDRYWEDIKLVKNVNEDDVMNILCRYFHDPDFFVQRESVLCICTWINAKMSFLPASCKEIMFAILSDATKSLDLELKLIALNKWQFCLNSNSYFNLSSSCDMNSYLKSLCDSGFGLSLISAVDDYDEAVKFKAAGIMLELRNKITKTGYSKDFIPVQEETFVSKKLEESSVIQPISKEEKNMALDNVMNLSTAEQISNISRPANLPNINDLKKDCLSAWKSESLLCSVESFWMCLWSEKLDCILSPDSSSTSIFSEFSISLLEDIIAAEKAIRPKDETRDCY